MRKREDGCSWQANSVWHHGRVPSKVQHPVGRGSSKPENPGADGSFKEEAEEEIQLKLDTDTVFKNSLNPAYTYCNNMA